MSEAAMLDAAAEFLRGLAGGVAPKLGLVLGSGLKGFAARVDDAVEVPFGEVPGWPAPRVEGHGGSAVFGRVRGLPVVCLTGRVHLYEGWTPAEVVRAVRTLRRLGVPRFLLSNAAGGIHADFAAGDLMVVTDHLNRTGSSPLLGPHEAALGPRFPDLSAVYAPALRQRLHGLDGDLRQGVYAGNLGPAYETPAEVEALARAGADAVGMSTVHEAIALAAMGAEVAAVSLISNLAAGRAPRPLSHDEVIAAGRAAEPRFCELVAGFCGSLAEEGA